MCCCDWLLLHQFSQIESENGEGRAERSEKYTPGSRACLEEHQGRQSKCIDRTRQLTVKDSITIRVQALDRENRKAVFKARSRSVKAPKGVKMQIHLKAEKVSSLGYRHPRFLPINTISLRNVVQGSSRLVLKVTGGMATSQTGSRIDIVLMMLILQAAESKS